MNATRRSCGWTLGATMCRSAPTTAMLIVGLGCSESPFQTFPVPEGMRIGGDVSFLQEIEDHGGTYSDSTGVRDLLELMRAHGFTAIRLRLWHTPDGPYSSLAQVRAVATRIHALGLELFLDIHYSDTWADAGHQAKPATWDGLAFDALADSVYQYSHDVIAALRSQGTLPSMVQIGNEIRAGMLWPEGRVGGEFETPEQWSRLVALLDAGRRGVLDAAPDDPPEIVIHIDAGGDNQVCRWFFDHLVDRGFAFDAIGVSFYPKWHGTLLGLERNLANLSYTYEKKLYVVETAYPWTFNWNDDTNNIFGTTADLHEGYPPSVEGQGEFLRALRQIVNQVPEGRGAGVFYWAPEWIAVPGVPSAWENATLFNFGGVMLPSMKALTGHG